MASNYPEVYNIQTDATMANPFTLDFDRVRDSVNNRFEQAKDQIRIPLNQTFTDLFMKIYDSTTVYKTDTSLRQYFPGFALSASTAGNPNALIRINLLDTNTKLGLYYRTNSTSVVGTRDTMVDYFKFCITR